MQPETSHLKSERNIREKENIKENSEIIIKLFYDIPILVEYILQKIGYFKVDIRVCSKMKNAIEL